MVNWIKGAFTDFRNKVGKKQAVAWMWSTVQLNPKNLDSSSNPLYGLKLYLMTQCYVKRKEPAMWITSTVYILVIALAQLSKLGLFSA